MFTDALWAAMAPRVGASRRRRGGSEPDLPDRTFLEALLYVARTGVPWRDLPSEFGTRDAVDNRLGRWTRSGRMRRLFELTTAGPQLGEVRRALLDSTIVRARQHAAGARRPPSGGRRPAGAAAG